MSEAKHASTGTSLQLNNSTYSVLKWIGLIFLPAAGALYFSLSSIWNLPYGEEVVGTITIIDTFLGAILGVSTVSYNKNEPVYDGNMYVHDGVSGIQLASDDAGPLVDKGYIVLKVVDEVDTSETQN